MYIYSHPHTLQVTLRDNNLYISSKYLSKMLINYQMYSLFIDHIVLCIVLYIFLIVYYFFSLCDCLSRSVCLPLRKQVMNPFNENQYSSSDLIDKRYTIFQ